MNYTELLEKDFAMQIAFNNVKKYHEIGYKGKGIVILNSENNNEHMLMTNKVIADYAPETTVINSNITGSTIGGVVTTYLNINGEKIDFEEAIDKCNIKIVSTSIAGTTSEARLNYFKDIQKRKGVIFFVAAGNEGSDGITGIYSKNDTAITVGAAYLQDGQVKLHHYSSRGQEMDFVSFLARGQGTSAACPALASMTALLLQKYGDFNQVECIEILKSISMDLGQPGKDPNYGWGIPILPLTDNLEILESLRGENVGFKDVEQDRWSKTAIDRCVEEGLIVGFEDGTFRPTEYVTREQFAIILTRILDKIK